MFVNEPEIEVGTTGFQTKNSAGAPFDLLNRKASGERLSALVERLVAPTVIALDGPWGSGKSHFLKLWSGAHKNENGGTAQPVYFNAFAEDYLDDPLLSLVAAIDRVRHDGSKDTAVPSALKKLMRAAGPLTRSVIRVGLAAVTAGASEGVGGVADAALAAGQEEGQDLLDGFWTRERSRADALDAFRNALAELAHEQPLVLIVDELDRCRPDYALNLLEIAKHTFAVPRVHFILGVSLDALQHSVRKRYGVGIDGDAYLQKFFQLRIALPDDMSPDRQNWQTIFAERCKQLAIPPKLEKEAIETLQQISQSRAVSLRDARRIASRLSLGSGLIDHIQKMTVAAIAIADMKVWAQRS
jgi:energy-coupling factor transporter ATP-binding protein EcfA2